MVDESKRKWSRKKKIEDTCNHLAKVQELLSSSAFQPVKSKTVDPMTILAPKVSRSRKNQKLSVWATQLSQVLLECIACRRWDAAASILLAFTYESTKTTEILWTAGFQIFCNHPNSNASLLKEFSNAMYRMDQLCRKVITLENVNYYLEKADLDGADEAIGLEGNTVRRQLSKLNEKEQHINNILRGYGGLIEYARWEVMQSGNEISEDDVIRCVATRAIEIFEVVLECPGVSDIFISKYIKLMEFYDRQEAAIAVLEKHCKLNPRHVNAYGYWYELVKRHRPNDKLKLEQLFKIITTINPSDHRLFELMRVLKCKSNRTVFEKLINAVDYPVWKDDGQLWQEMAMLMIKMIKCDVERDVEKLDELWLDRMTWWPAFHFDPDDVLITDETTAKLFMYKAIVLALFTELEHPYVLNVEDVLKNSSWPALLEEFKSLQSTIIAAKAGDESTDDFQDEPKEAVYSSVEEKKTKSGEPVHSSLKKMAKKRRKPINSSCEKENTDNRELLFPSFEENGELLFSSFADDNTANGKLLLSSFEEDNTANGKLLLSSFAEDDTANGELLVSSFAEDDTENGELFFSSYEEDNTDLKRAIDKCLESLQSPVKKKSRNKCAEDKRQQKRKKKTERKKDKKERRKDKKHDRLKEKLEIKKNKRKKKS